MLPKKANRERVLDELDHHGGLREGVVDAVHRATGVPAADVYGVATFYHLLAEPHAGVRVCRGLSCKLAGCDQLMADFVAAGRAATFSSCLGRCDMAPASWDPEGDPSTPQPALTPQSDELAIDLMGQDGSRYEALSIARERGAIVAIGHPYPATLELLERELPKLAEEGIELVRISEILR